MYAVYNVEYPPIHLQCLAGVSTDQFGPTDVEVTLIGND